MNSIGTCSHDNDYSMRIIVYAIDRRKSEREYLPNWLANAGLCIGTADNGVEEGPAPVERPAPVWFHIEEWRGEEGWRPSSEGLSPIERSNDEDLPDDCLKENGWMTPSYDSINIWWSNCDNEVIRGRNRSIMMKLEEEKREQKREMWREKGKVE